MMHSNVDVILHNVMLSDVRDHTSLCVDYSVRLKVSANIHVEVNTPRDLVENPVWRLVHNEVYRRLS